MLFAFAAFLIFLSAIVGLLALKQRELSTGRVLFSDMRAKADAEALHAKALMEAGLKDLEKLPPHALHLARVGVHAAAVGFGHLAHWVGEQSHKLADLVSHKHRFEKQELRSEFLKKMIEHKKGGGSDTLDTTP